MDQNIHNGVNELPFFYICMHVRMDFSVLAMHGYIITFLFDIRCTQCVVMSLPPFFMGKLLYLKVYLFNKNNIVQFKQW